MKLIKIPFADGHWINADQIIAVQPFTSNDPAKGDIKSILYMVSGQQVYFPQTSDEVAEAIRSQLEPS